MRKEIKAAPALSGAAGRFTLFSYRALAAAFKEMAPDRRAGREQVRVAELRLLPPQGSSALGQSEAETRLGRRGVTRESH